MSAFKIGMIVLIGAAILYFLWELLLFWVLGTPTKANTDLVAWLRDDVRLAPYNGNVMYKPAMKRCTNIMIVRVHKPSIFSKYYAERTDGHCFRILKSSQLHRLVEQKHKRLLRTRQ